MVAEYGLLNSVENKFSPFFPLLCQNKLFKTYLGQKNIPNLRYVLIHNL